MFSTTTGPVQETRQKGDKGGYAIPTQPQADKGVVINTLSGKAL